MEQKSAQFPGLGDLFGTGGGGGGVDLRRYDNQTGFATLFTDPKNSMDLIVDVTDIIDGESDGHMMVTAMAAKGTYTDGKGTVLPLHMPLEEEASTLFKLARSKNGDMVDFLQPQLTMRTSDAETLKSFRKSVDSPWFASMPIMRTSLGPKRTVLDGMELIKLGFLVTPRLAQMIQSYQLTRVKSWPGNFDVSLTFLSQWGQLSVTYSIIKPPLSPMIPRLYDDRLPYFTQDYRDLGIHTKSFDKDMIDPRKTVDPTVSVIWKFDLDRLPNNQILIHVDPSVPERWHQSFKRGIEAWNVAFVNAGRHNKTIRAVLPSDSDWPKDYDAGDARFNTISWAIDSDNVFSMGIAKVDPRSGEILKSDIIMGAGWVRAWLTDLHAMKLSEGQTFKTGFFHEKLERDREVSDIKWNGIDELNDEFTPAAVLLQADAKSSGHVEAHSDSKSNTHVENERAALNLLGDRPASLVAMGLPRESWYNIVEDGLKAIVMHETGHILGLRHNFKGSLGVSYECTQNMTCSAEQGLTASIMDYLPMNIPSAGVENVHLFTPVLGAYDKLAIRYGYTKLPTYGFTRVEEVSMWDGMPVTPPFLKGILEEANQFQVCKDGDRQLGSDPLCQLYDLTAEPLRWMEDQVALFQKAQKRLFEIAVGPGEPYWQYGEMVWDIVLKVFKMQDQLVKWVGGMNVSYVHRPNGQARTLGEAPVNGKNSIQSISAKDQRKAIRLLFELARPARKGLVPSSALLANLPWSDGETISFMDLKMDIKFYQKQIIDKLFRESTLRHVEVSGQFGGLGLETFLDDMLYHIVGTYEGEGFEKCTPQDWDLQMFLVDNLVAEPKSSQRRISESIQPHISMAVKAAMRAVQGGLKRLDSADVAADWSRCSNPDSEMCTCYGRVRFWLGEKWTSPIDALGDVECKPESFGLEANQVPDGYCECLQTSAAKTPLRTHLLALNSKLKQAATSKGLMVESGVSRQSSVWLVILSAVALAIH